jgi:hypothetical protein
MIWLTFFLAMSPPVIAMLPGELGEMVRRIKAVIGFCLLMVMGMVAWTSMVSYHGVYCLAGNVISCQQVYELSWQFVDDYNAHYTYAESQRRFYAHSARTAAQRAMSEDDRTHDRYLELLENYNARKHTSYVLTPDNRVVRAPRVATTPSATTPSTLPSYDQLMIQRRWAGLQN